MKHTALVACLVIFFHFSNAESPAVLVHPCTEDGEIPVPVSFTSEGCIHPPCPLVRGTTANANITFKIPEYTETARVQIKAKVYGLWVPFSPPDDNVCHKLVNSSCPLDVNDIAVYNMEIPVEKFYPTISLTLKVKIIDERHRVISCMKVECKVVKPA